MAQTSDNDVDADIQVKIFEKLAANDTLGFEQLIVSLKNGVDFLDPSGMTPLQHACCKGNKQAVQILLDMGADVNYNKQGNSYTTLHFAALSGKSDICRMLLDCGVNPHVLNSVNRTATQMAAFVGNYECVETINNYVLPKVLECYSTKQGQQSEPYVPPQLLKAFHKFVIEVNLHPVRIALNLQTLGLTKHLAGLREALGDMCEKEMKKASGVNELMAFKFHYLRWIIAELMRCETQCKAQRKEKGAAEAEQQPAVAGEAPKNDFIELFIKRVLKENKQGQLDYVEFTIRECVREYPFRECTIFRQVVQQLASKEALPALYILRGAINGQRPFGDELSFCSTCGHEKPDKKCSKCKAVQYCDRECQRLHWFMHKKTCARPNTTAAVPTSGGRGPIDTEELRQELAKMAAN